MPKINAAGLSLIKTFEGCVLTAYPDPRTGAEPFTIGYGHTGSCSAIGMGNVSLGMTITNAQADALLQSDLESFEKIVNDAVSRNLTPNQFAALVSFCYNVGPGDPATGEEGFLTSTLLRDVNAGDFAGAAAQFARWDNPGSDVQAGLDRRRAAEAALFSTP